MKTYTRKGLERTFSKKLGTPVLIAGRPGEYRIKILVDGVWWERQPFRSLIGCEEDLLRVADLWKRHGAL